MIKIHFYAIITDCLKICDLFRNRLKNAFTPLISNNNKMVQVPCENRLIKQNFVVYIII